MGDLADLSAVDMLAAFTKRAVSPVDVARAVIERIAACEPHLNALYAYDPDAALAQAAVSEGRWMAGTARALEGVPITLKENIRSIGVPVPLGTAATQLVPALDDAPPAARVRAAGAVLIAKTTMPDYGMTSSGVSSFHALTRNPWDVGKNPGGSSAGAAAAAAAGYGPLHIGTDIGGSIRLPASWCGVFGLKPSFGRVPIDPTYYGRVAGPMTRTVRDSALLMRELSKPDDRDPTRLPPMAIDWLALERSFKGVKIGYHGQAGCGMAVDGQVSAVFDAAIETLKDAGAVLTPITPFFTRQMLDGMDRFFRQRAWQDLSALSPEARVRVQPYIRDWASAAQRYTGTDVFDGASQMMAMRQAAVNAARPFDFVISPVAPVPAFSATMASPVNDPERPFEHIAFTLPYNMSDQPAASINAGYTAQGLPIGVQITGQRFDDLGVLQLAHGFETLRGRQRAWPVFDPPPTG
jgi:aspartyl-tRNA(Asn)/glutamyl-tRNA(Gln) amidotransferase subunit A